jgi:hypothetical protein
MHRNPAKSKLADSGILLKMLWRIIENKEKKIRKIPGNRKIQKKR